MRRLPKTLTQDEAWSCIRSLPDTWAGRRNRICLELAYRGGLRVGEIVSARRDGLADGMLRIIGKGNKERVVPLEAQTLELVERFMAETPSEWLVCKRDGGQLCRRYVQAMVERVASKAIGRHVTPHMFRHSYATELLREGATIRDVQMLLGHASLNTTMIYTHVDPKDLQDRILGRKRAG